MAESGRRDKDLVPRKGKKYDELVKLFQDVRKGFEDQGRRSDDIMDYWDIYNCVLNSKQFYNGNAKIYVPIVRNAINARKTRFLNQMFPSSGRYIDATSTDGGVPHAVVALLEHYIRRAQLRTRIMAPLLRNGDVEGQYNLYVDWNRTERHIVERVRKPAVIQLAGVGPDGNAMADGEDIDDISEEIISDAGPSFEVIHDTDVLILPATCDSIEEALMEGGSVTIIRRWTKTTLEDRMESGELLRKPAEQLLEMSGSEDIHRSAEKEMIDAAGIKAKGRVFQVYETWKCMDTDDGRRLCRSYYGGYELMLGVRRNPYWNDRCPLLSAPVEKLAGSFKGVSPIAGGVDSLQYHATDVANQAADSSTYSMLPIVMTDPAKNPRTSTMILNLAAIWEVDPNATRFAEFPKLWQDGIALIQADTAQIFQTLGVNPAMLPQQTGRPGAKRNQAEIALEQTVDILTTAEACGVIEENILTPTLERMVDYDHQFRDDEITVRAFGELGVTAKMESVKVLQNAARYNFTWFGVEQARNASQQQQQIAYLNVAMSPPMQMALAKAGYMVNPAPALEHAAGNIFGWRMGRQIIVDARQQLAMDPEIENGLLTDGFEVMVHPLDEDPKHIQSHQQALQLTGDPAGTIRPHIQRHMLQMQAKAAAMAQQKMQQQGGPGPGQVQGPRPGAQPQGPKLVRGPPGAIHADRMPAAGAAIMPRKT